MNIDSLSYDERQLIKHIRLLDYAARENFIVFVASWTKACNGPLDVTEQQPPKFHLVKNITNKSP